MDAPVRGRVSALDVGDLNLPGKVMATAWKLPDNLPEEEWLARGHVLLDYEGKLAWLIGDWWAYGLHKYGARKGWAEKVQQEFGRFKFETLKQYGWVANKIPPSRRLDALTFGHHMAVAAMTPKAQGNLLAQAEAEGLTVRDLRAAVAKGRLAGRHEAIASGTKASQIGGTFALIYADPPWRFEVHGDSVLGKLRSPDLHYPVMMDDAIRGLQVDGRHVSEIAAKDAGLFLWCTSSNIHRALGVMGAWGFTFKTSAVWDKQRTGTGYIWLNQHEVLLYGSRGEFPAPVHKGSSVFSYPRGRHSQKPTEVRKSLAKMYPALGEHGRIELFARGDIPGWTVWGNEAGGADAGP